jgi:hypothetical protein
MRLLFVLALIGACASPTIAPRTVLTPPVVVAAPEMRDVPEVLDDADVTDASSASFDGDVAPSEVAVSTPTAPAEVPRTYLGRSEDEWIRRMATQPVVHVGERFHSTLNVWRIDLGDGIEISFQPAQEHLETFWRREIASWHLVRLLGIRHRAPPVVGRRIAASTFGRDARRTGLIVDRNGMVVGSAAAWVPVLQRVNMHVPAARALWARWVNPEFPLPSDARTLERARQVAEVLVLDYLAANYDRWNCCNIMADANGDLVFRDNDAGWVPSVINNLGSPGVVRRLPRSLYEALQRATPEALRTSIEGDPESARGALIPAESYVGYERRRTALLAHVRRAIARYGEAAVFPWP